MQAAPSWWYITHEWYFMGKSSERIEAGIWTAMTLRHFWIHCQAVVAVPTASEDLRSLLGLSFVKDR